LQHYNKKSIVLILLNWIIITETWFEIQRTTNSELHFKLLVLVIARIKNTHTISIWPWASYTAIMNQINVIIFYILHSTMMLTKLWVLHFLYCFDVCSNKENYICSPHKYCINHNTNSPQIRRVPVWDTSQCRATALHRHLWLHWIMSFSQTIVGVDVSVFVSYPVYVLHSQSLKSCVKQFLVRLLISQLNSGPQGSIP
jgi:hypothetical protein